MRTTKLFPLLLAAGAFAAPLPLAAQRMICLPPAVTSTTAKECTLKVTGLPSQQVVVLRIENAPPSREVRYEFKWSGATAATPPATGAAAPATPASAVAPPYSGTVTTDASGAALITWTGMANARETVIQAEAVIGTLKLEREIRITPATTLPPNRSLALPEMRSVPHWFEERQLRDSVRVIVVNAGDSCSDNIVQFRPYATIGSASPDSVRPTMLGGNCVATTWWRLGKGVGRQHLRASLSDDPSKTTVLTAIARAMPRVGGGVALTRDFREYRELKGTGAAATIDTVSGNTETQAVVSVDFPVVPSARWFRGVLGASFKNPERDWYLGISALQPIFGVTRESVDVDLQVVMHIGRRDVLRNPVCAEDMDLSDCRTKEKYFFPMGVGFMGFVNAQGLLTNVLGAFQ